MKINDHKTQQDKSLPAANATVQPQKNNTPSFYLEDNRPGITAQRQQQATLSGSKVTQLRRVVVTYNNSVVVGLDTENLDQSQIESLIANPGVDPESKEQLIAALQQGDYLGGKPVQEPQPLEPQQPFFGFGLGLVQHGPNKQAILGHGLIEAKRKLDLVKDRNPGYDHIDDFIQFVSEPERFTQTGERKGNTLALAKIQWKKVRIFEAFYDDKTTDEQRSDTLIHEISHIIYNSHDYSYKWNRIFKYLTEDEHRHNPDSVVTRMNAEIEEPSQEAPPQTIAGENIPGAVPGIADKAFAVLGDILYHADIPQGEAIQPDITDYLKTTTISPEHYGAFTQRILGTINLLNMYQPLFRNKNIRLVKGENWSVQSQDNPVTVTLTNTEEKEIAAAVEGSTEKALVWLAFQISKHKAVARHAIKIILHKFYDKHGNNPNHEQGSFPSAIKLDPGKV